MSGEMLSDAVSERRAVIEGLLWRKFQALCPFFSMSFCLVFVGQEAIASAEKSLILFPELNDKLHYTGPREKNGILLDPELKVYMPALPLYEDEGKKYCVFSVLLSGENFCELQLKKGANTAVCFREKDHIPDGTGKYNVFPGGTFGWGLPHPYKPKFRPSEHYVWLVEHRLGADPSWPGFEPVWIKCLEYPSCAPRYFRIEIVWVQMDSYASAVVVVAEKDRGEAPEELQNFYEFSVVRRS